MHKARAVAAFCGSAPPALPGTRTSAASTFLPGRERRKGRVWTAGWWRRKVKRSAPAVRSSGVREREEDARRFRRRRLTLAAGKRELLFYTEDPKLFTN